MVAAFTIARVLAALKAPAVVPCYVSAGGLFLPCVANYDSTRSRYQFGLLTRTLDLHDSGDVEIVIRFHLAMLQHITNASGEVGRLWKLSRQAGPYKTPKKTRSRRPAAATRAAHASQPSGPAAATHAAPECAAPHCHASSRTLNSRSKPQVCRQCSSTFHSGCVSEGQCALSDCEGTVAERKESA